MGHRNKPRFRMVLPVQMYGTDSAGHSFTLLAYTMDISTGGARLAGINLPVKVDDVVTVRYKQAKARFRVAWAIKDQIGIEYIANEKFIWVELPADEGFLDTQLVQEPGASAKEKPAAGDASVSPPAQVAPVSDAVSQVELAEDIANALESCVDSLRRLNRLVSSAELGRSVGHHFHAAVAHLRNTAWAVQQGTELLQDGKDFSSILETANAERVRYTTQLCRELAEYRQHLAPGVSEEHRRMLDSAVLKLSRLTGIDSQSAIPPRRPAPGPGDLTALLAGLDKQIRSSSLPTGAALELVAERSRAFTGADGLAIAFRDEEDMVCCASAGTAPTVGLRFSTSEGLVGEAVATRTPVLCADTETDPRVDKKLCRALNLRSSVIVPITQNDTVRGILQVFSSCPGFFDASCVAALQQLAQLAAAFEGEVELLMASEAGELC